MSLIGNRTAIISAGMSCQTAWQIDKYLELAKQFTGDRTLEIKSSVFDWLICPPASACAMLDAGEFFPESAGELTIKRLPGCTAEPLPLIAGWSKYNAFFWHDFTGPAILPSDFSRVRDKYEFLKGRLFNIGAERIVVVVSNTQNNLDLVQNVTGTVSPMLRASEINRLKTSLEKVLQKPVSIALVAYSDRYAEDTRLDGKLFYLERDGSEWQGDEAAWRPVMRQLLLDETGDGSPARRATDPAPSAGSVAEPHGIDESLLVTKNCRHGRITYVPTDGFIGKSLELYGEWCEGEIILFSRLLHAGDVVLDLCANIGTHTLAFTKLVGSAGKVHAFEPQPAIYDILCRNIAANALSNVSPHRAVAGAADGVDRIPYADHGRPDDVGFDVALVPVGNGDLEAPTLTLDSLNLPRVNLIKISGEGTKPQALRGASATLTRSRPILYVENSHGEASTALVSLIRNAGYRLWWHLSSPYNQFNFARNSYNAWPNALMPNMVCLPREAAVPPWPFKEVADGSEFSDPAALIQRG